MSDKPRENEIAEIEAIFSKSEVNSIRGAIDEVKCIAKGGMSYIFRARQPSLGRYIVVKRLKDELLGNPEMMARFKREARALASVLHQNVAHVYDFVEDTRESYIVMEFIEGIDLSTVVEKMGNLPPMIAASLLLGVARGTSFIHTHNLIHRDIKPSNIRITNRGTVKLMDFGIVMDTENQSLTRPGMMVGSPQYLSPEQVLGDPLTPRADIFLLGIVLYEMVTGSRPFKDEAGETVFQRIRESKYVPARVMNPSLPRSLDRIIRTCLEKRPERRYQNCLDLIRDLERFLGQERVSHSEDIILKYVDQEALLTPAAEYREVELSQGMWTRQISVPMWLLSTAVAIVLGVMIGIFAGRAASAPSSTDKPTSVPGFPSAKPFK